MYYKEYETYRKKTILWPLFKLAKLTNKLSEILIVIAFLFIQIHAIIRIWQGNNGYTIFLEKWQYPLLLFAGIAIGINILYYFMSGVSLDEWVKILIYPNIFLFATYFMSGTFMLTYAILFKLILVYLISGFTAKLTRRRKFKTCKREVFKHATNY